MPRIHWGRNLQDFSVRCNLALLAWFENNKGIWRILRKISNIFWIFFIELRKVFNIGFNPFWTSQKYLFRILFPPSHSSLKTLFLSSSSWYIGLLSFIIVLTSSSMFSLTHYNSKKSSTLASKFKDIWRFPKEIERFLLWKSSYIELVPRSLKFWCLSWKRTIKILLLELFFIDCE